MGFILGTVTLRNPINQINRLVYVNLNEGNDDKAWQTVGHLSWGVPCFWTTPPCPCPHVFRTSALRMWRKLRSNLPGHWNRSAPCSAVDFSWRPAVPCVPEMLFASKSSFVLEAICTGGLRLTWNAYRIFKVFKEIELSCIMNYVESCGNMRKFGPHSEPIQSPLRTWCASFGQPAS